MRRLATSLAAVGGIVGLTLAIALQVYPTAPRARLLDLYILFLGGLAMLGFVHATRAANAEAGPSLFERVLRRGRPGIERPPGLAKLEREVALSTSSAFDLHVRLRPTLREIALHRLAGRGIDLDTGSPEARELLGSDLWELVRPERRPPDDRFAPGTTLPQVRSMLDTLDKI